MEREIMIVTLHKTYICENYEVFTKKKKALETLHIPFSCYLKAGDEWFNVSPTPKDISICIKTELKGVNNGKI